VEPSVSLRLDATGDLEAGYTT